MYKAFISYRHTPHSRLCAERVEGALKRYGKPIWKVPVSIFRDERVLKAGDDLPKEIRAALEDSEFLIYLASKDAAQSEWVIDELRIWCDELKRSDRLIIVHISDEIMVDRKADRIVWEATNALPQNLETHLNHIPVWIDLTWAHKDEQLDLRNVEFKKAINLVAARFRGVKPGEMNDIEVLTYRRNLLLRNVGIGMIAASAAIAVWFGVQASKNARVAEARRIDAENQTQIAKREKEDADKQRDLATDAADVATDQTTESMLAQGRYYLPINPAYSFHYALASFEVKPRLEALQLLRDAVSHIPIKTIVTPESAQESRTLPDLDTGSTLGDCFATDPDLKYGLLGASPEKPKEPCKVGLYDLGTGRKVEDWPLAAGEALIAPEPSATSYVATLRESTLHIYALKPRGFSAPIYMDTGVVDAALSEGDFPLAVLKADGTVLYVTKAGTHVEVKALVTIPGATRIKVHPTGRGLVVISGRTINWLDPTGRIDNTSISRPALKDANLIDYESRFPLIAWGPSPEDVLVLDLADSSSGNEHDNDLVLLAWNCKSRTKQELGRSSSGFFFTGIFAPTLTADPSGTLVAWSLGSVKK